MHDDTPTDDRSVFDSDDTAVPAGPIPGAASSPSRSATPGIETLARIRADFEQISPHGPAPWSLINTYVTTAYLDCIDRDTPPTPAEVETQLLALLSAVVRDENTKLDKSEAPMTVPRHLTPWQIAMLLVELHHVIKIAPANGSHDTAYDLVAMYNAWGTNRGVYTTSENDLRAMARRYHVDLNLNEFKEVLATLVEIAPRRTVTRNPDLIAVNNGIFNYSNDPVVEEVDGRQHRFAPKALTSFHPDLVYISKCHVDYVPDAPNPVIVHVEHDPETGAVVETYEWDVETWVAELSESEGIPELLWEIIGAVIRPHVRWNKTAWFYSEVGNNGKGTLCALMRNLVGHDAHTSIPLSEMGKEFALEPLVKASAIIVDENDVGAYIDKAANLKALVTNDVIQINRKYRTPIAFQFFGFMVQCLNGMPKMKDKSDSFHRRQLFVPFDKSFTGHERGYIKDDFLKRSEVLEYVLWYVLHKAGAHSPGSYYSLSEPAATKNLLLEYAENNDPVRAFWAEFRDEFVWDLLPFSFLYDLFKAWFTKNMPSGVLISHRSFVNDLAAVVRNDANWDCEDRNKKYRPSTMMDEPEPLIATYELKDWLSPTYTGSDPVQRSRPLLRVNYRGLLRTTAPAVVLSAADMTGHHANEASETVTP